MDGDERIKTGIKGFDALIEGGIPIGANVLITGTPGTGKTIFGMQYIYNGAKSGENGVYVSLDTTAEQLRGQAMQFGWDIEGLEKENKISILKVPPDRAEINLFNALEFEVKRINAKRIVFDSLEDFLINVSQFAIPLVFAQELSGEQKEIGEKYEKLMESEQSDVRQFGRAQGKAYYSAEKERGGIIGISDKRAVFLTIWQFKQLGTTNIIITTAKQGGDQLTVDGVSEFACDGLAKFDMASVGGTLNRTIEVFKMRKTRIDGLQHAFDFTKNGIDLV